MQLIDCRLPLWGGSPAPFPSTLAPKAPPARSPSEVRARMGSQGLGPHRSPRALPSASPPASAIGLLVAAEACLVLRACAMMKRWPLGGPPPSGQRTRASGQANKVATRNATGNRFGDNNSSGAGSRTHCTKSRPTRSATRRSRRHPRARTAPWAEKSYERGV